MSTNVKRNSCLFIGALSIASVLSGCGDSDSPHSIEEPKPPLDTPAPLPKNVFGHPDADVAKTRSVNLTIASRILGFNKKATAYRYSCQKYGGPYPCNNDRVAGNFPQRIPADDVFNKTIDLFDYEYILDGVDIDLMKEGFKQSVRPDVFNDQYASIVDVLIVAAKKYGLDIKYHYDEELGTHWIDSINGIDGMQPEWLPDNENMLVPYGHCSGPGGWKAVFANGQFDIEGALGDGGDFFYRTEEIYQRLDEFYVPSNAGITLIPACKEEKELRAEIYRKELERIAANDGKVVIPEVVLNFEWDRKAVFKDVEVTAHNLRSDIFKPGVITHMDLILSLPDHSPAVEVGANLWGAMSTGVVINGYSMNYMSMDGLDDKGEFFHYGHDADGASGWNYHAGEYERVNDSAYGMISTFKAAFCGIEFTGMSEQVKAAGNDNQSIRFTLPGSPCTGGDWRPGSGTWLTPTPDELSPDGDPKKGPIHLGMTPYSWGDKTPYAPLGTFTDSRGFTKNRAYYAANFGGNGLHVLPDVVTMRNAEYFEFFRDAFPGGSEDYTRKQVEAGKALATGYRFEPLPQELNYKAKDVSEAIKPLTENHFGWGVPDCDVCHEAGANGGHVSAEMKPFECAECHGSNGAPEGHGEQSTCGWCHSATLKGHGDAYTEKELAEDQWNPLTDMHAFYGRQKKAGEYWGLHTDFPEPASCMTCHPSSNDRFITK